MNSSRIFNFQIIFLTIIICFSSSWLINCDHHVHHHNQQRSCNMKQFDYCISNFYYKQFGIPSNDEQLKQSCKTVRTLYDCLNDYGKRCMSYALYETMMLIMDSLTKSTFDICSQPINHVEHLKVFKYSKCLNQYSNEIGECSKYLKQILLYTMESTSDQEQNQSLSTERLSKFCCNIRNIIICQHNKIESYCGDDTLKFIESNDYNPFLSLINSVCLDYQPSSRNCRNYMLPFGWKSKMNQNATIAKIIDIFFS